MTQPKWKRVKSLPLKPLEQPDVVILSKTVRTLIFIYISVLGDGI